MKFYINMPINIIHILSNVVKNCSRYKKITIFSRFFYFFKIFLLNLYYPIEWVYERFGCAMHGKTVCLLFHSAPRLSLCNFVIILIIMNVYRPSKNFIENYSKYNEVYLENESYHKVSDKYYYFFIYSIYCIIHYEIH